MKKTIKSIKRIGAAMLCSVMCAGITSSLPAFAEVVDSNRIEEDYIFSNVSSGILRASDQPDKFYNITAKGAHTSKLSDWRSKTGTNTLYYFNTSTGSFALDHQLKESGATAENIDRYLEIQLYERTSLKNDWALLETQEIVIEGARALSEPFVDGFVFSLAAELIQALIGRGGDIDDAICNAFGAIVGYLLYLTLKGFSRSLRRNAQPDTALRKSGAVMRIPTISRNKNSKKLKKPIYKSI